MNKVVWRKASRSTAEGDNCVEVAGVPRPVAIRDSKNPDGVRIIISHREFRRFAEAVKGL